MLERLTELRKALYLQLQFYYKEYILVGTRSGRLPDIEVPYPLPVLFEHKHILSIDPSAGMIVLKHSELCSSEAYILEGDREGINMYNVRC